MIERRSVSELRNSAPYQVGHGRIQRPTSLGSESLLRLPTDAAEVCLSAESGPITQNCHFRVRDVFAVSQMAERGLQVG